MTRSGRIAPRGMTFDRALDMIEYRAAKGGLKDIVTINYAA